ncbi:nucleoside hydrolase [Streptosporangium sp. NPDC003464]
MSQVRRVVVDTDTGIDDALALLYLAGRPDAEITAVTSVFGNCAEEDAARNIGYVTRLLGLEVPIARGADRALSGRAPAAAGAHGADGLGDRGYDRPLPQVTGESGAELLVRLAREHPGELDLLALGPLTNLALALRRAPDLLTGYRSVVMMGGSGPRTGPGRALTADTNIVNDPAAARTVLSAPRNELVAVGVNVTGVTVLDEAALGPLRAAGTARARFACEILDAYLDSYRGRWGRRAVPLHDPLAAGILLDPGLATASATGPVRVVGDGPLARAHLMRVRAGQAPRSPRWSVPDTRVIMEVDSARSVAGFIEVLTR